MPRGIKARIAAALEWERGYAAGHGITVAELRARGRVVAPCNCDWPNCEGWQSLPADIWNEDSDYGRAMRARYGGTGWTWPPSDTLPSPP